MKEFVPEGYESFAVAGTHVVVRAEHTSAIRDALAGGTFHQWASRQPGAEAMHGRGVAWGVSLSDGTPVVVRHSRHGGMLAPLTRDLFLPPTRAPRELDAALRLEAAGVPTARVLAFAVYPAVGPLSRADVITNRLRGASFVDAWRRADPAGRDSIVAALAELCRKLLAANAIHPDLNASNVLVDDGRAWVLDVDRVYFAPSDPGAAARNRERFVRSMRRWRHRGLDIEAADLERIRQSLS